MSIDEETKDACSCDEGAEEAPRFELVLVRACVVALWADGSMAASERDALSQVIASVARTKAERDRLRRMTLQDLNRHEVLDEVSRLEPTQRLHLFDRSVAILRSDRRVGRKEMAFLAELRRRCGVPWWAYQRRLHGIVPKWRAVALAAAGALLVAAVTWFMPEPPPQPPVAAPSARAEAEPEAEVKPPPEAETHPPLLLPGPPEPLPDLEPEQLYAAVRRSVVTVYVRRQGQPTITGSGAVIGIDVGRNSYFVITNKHVVYQEAPEGSRLDLEVQFENQARFDAVLDFYSRRHDLALLAVEGTPLWAAVVALRPSASLAVGERVYAVGSPMGLRHTFTEGLISALRADSIQTDATVHSGSSGGPLFDRHGLVCGIVTATHASKDFSFAIYADAVLDMLQERAQAPGE